MLVYLDIWFGYGEQKGRNCIVDIIASFLDIMRRQGFRIYLSFQNMVDAKMFN